MKILLIAFLVSGSQAFAEKPVFNSITYSAGDESRASESKLIFATSAKDGVSVFTISYLGHTQQIVRRVVPRSFYHEQMEQSVIWQTKMTGVMKVGSVMKCLGRVRFASNKGESVTCVDALPEANRKNFLQWFDQLVQILLEP